MEAAATSIGDSGLREVKVVARTEISGGTTEGCVREAVVLGGHGGIEKRRDHRGGERPRDYATVPLVGYTVVVRNADGGIGGYGGAHVEREGKDDAAMVVMALQQ
ncbi:glycosidase [Sesbania bispinosa]|nr:glycosidase [Sesbania bispinosa]